MIELGKAKRQMIQSVCQDSREVLVQSAVEGVMGRVWVPTLGISSYCLIHVGDFAYVLGLPPKGKGALELKTQIYESCSSDFIIPGDERWSVWIEDQFHGQYRLVSRYALKKDEYHFDKNKLKQYISEIPDGITIKRMDESLYEYVLKEEWSKDLASTYEDVQHFMEQGLGYVAIDGETVVSGCSAYGSCRGMFELQIGTKLEYRRKGLALACSAAFILECLDRDIFPSWDAANLHSVEVAEKLGYVYNGEYRVYQLAELHE